MPPSQVFIFGFRLLKELTTMYRDGWQVLFAEDQGIVEAYLWLMSDEWEDGNTQIPKIVWKDNFEASENVALWRNADHVGTYLLSLQGKSDLKYPCMIMRLKIFSIFEGVLGDTHTCMAESLRCSPETTTTC